MASFLTHPVQSSRASKSKFSQPRRIQKRGRTELGSSNVSWLQHGNLMICLWFFQVRHGQTMLIPRRIPSFFQSFYQPCGYVHDFLQVTTFFASQQWGNVNRSHMKTSKVMMMWWLHVVTVIGIDWDSSIFKLQLLFFSFWPVFFLRLAAAAPSCSNKACRRQAKCGAIRLTCNTRHGCHGCPSVLSVFDLKMWHVGRLNTLIRYLPTIIIIITI